MAENAMQQAENGVVRHKFRSEQISIEIKVLQKEQEIANDERWKWESIRDALRKETEGE